MWQRINKSVEITKFSYGYFRICFWKIPLFCLRKTGNLIALLPVNCLAWKKTKTFPSHKFTCVQKLFVDILHGGRVIMLTRVGSPKKNLLENLLKGVGVVIF